MADIIEGSYTEHPAPRRYWTPENARIAFFTALVAVVVHHWAAPHGIVLEADPGAEYVLTRTPTGWIVATADGTRAFTATKVRINAQDHD